MIRLIVRNLLNSRSVSVEVEDRQRLDDLCETAGDLLDTDGFYLKKGYEIICDTHSSEAGLEDGDTVDLVPTLWDGR